LSGIYTLNKSFQNRLRENVIDWLHTDIRDRQREGETERGGMENIILSRFYDCTLYKVLLLSENLPCPCSARPKKHNKFPPKKHVDERVILMWKFGN